MFTFFLVLHALIAASLVTVILMQRSEGGGLGMGGSPSGLMSARGAADFLTRATTVLATLFVVMSIGLAALATVQGGPRKIDSSLARPAPAAGSPLIPAAPAAAPGAVPFEGDPLAGAASALPGVTGNAPAVAEKAPAAARREAVTDAAAPRTIRATEPVRSTPPTAAPKADPAPPASTPTVTPPGVPAPVTGNGSSPQ